MAYTTAYDGKVELYKGPKTNAIKVIGDGDRLFGTNSKSTQFSADQANDCFKFMVTKAKEFGALVDVFCPDLKEKLGKDNNRFTVEQITSFDMTEYNMSFRKGYGVYLQIVKAKSDGDNAKGMVL